MHAWAKQMLDPENRRELIDNGRVEDAPQGVSSDDISKLLREPDRDKSREGKRLSGDH